MRPFSLFRLLLAGSIVLFLGILLEFRDQIGALGIGDTSEPAQVTTIAAAPPPTSEANVDAAVTAFLAHPLFRMDRQPVSAPGTKLAATNFSNMPRLAGIIMTDGARIAVFQTGGDNKSVLLHEGGSIGAWTVQTIRPQSVVVAGVNGVRELIPRPDALLNPSSSGATGTISFSASGAGTPPVPIGPPGARADTSNPGASPPPTGIFAIPPDNAVRSNNTPPPPSPAP